MTQVPEELPRSTLMGLMGGEIDSWEEGRVVMSIKLDERAPLSRGCDRHTYRVDLPLRLQV